MPVILGSVGASGLTRSMTSHHDRDRGGWRRRSRESHVNVDAQRCRVQPVRLGGQGPGV